METAIPPLFSKTDTLISHVIDGVEELIILQYFDTLNLGDFEATSELFAIEGMLQPPFEAMVIGRSEIAAYLKQEAQGFVLLPQEGQQVLESDRLEKGGLEKGDLERDSSEFLVLGKVQTPWFTVNVSWTFILNSSKQIVLAKVNLLASLQELMHLRR